MNKKLIAMAVAAGLAAPMAAANAEPTVYGKLQMELANIDDGKGTASTETDPGSEYMGSDDNKIGRLGVKGSEDLGGGMNAIYQFEWQVDTSDADAYDGTRIGMVGLKAGFGTIMAGSLKTPYKYYGGVSYDPFVATYLEARSRGGMSGKVADGASDADYNIGTSGTFGHHGFMADAISYKNKFGAVEVWVNTSLDEKGGAKGADGDINAGVKFKGGNFEAFVAMASNDSVTYNDSTTGFDYIADYSATKFGGMFNMGPHKIKLQIESTELATTQVDTGAGYTSAAGSWESDFMFVGYEMKMGKNVFVAQMGSRESSSGAYTQEQDYMTIGVIHKLSKKTRVFVGHNTSETSDNAGSAAVDASVTSLGLRVDF